LCRSPAVAQRYVLTVKLIRDHETRCLLTDVNDSSWKWDAGALEASMVQIASLEPFVDNMKTCIRGRIVF
jgi:hypothetical protein